MDSVILLEQSDGTVVAENDQNGLLGQNDSFIQLALPADGTYYLRIVDYWGDGGSSYTYRLHVSLPAQQTLPAPQITTLSPSSGKQGETINLTITGTNLSGTTAVNFTPSTGITISGIQATATQVTCSVIISSSATTGSRTVTVTNPGGTSNSLAFSVNTATTTAPAISSLSPSSGKQGATVNLVISGSNLSGATAVNFSSSTGITTSGIQSTATQVTCSVVISSTATTGSRSVTVTTPAGTSNSLTFSVTSSATGTAPTVANLTVTPVLISSGANIVVMLTGSFDFTDPDGDIVYTGTDATSAKMKFTQTLGSSCTITATGAYLNKPGVTSGHLEFTTQTFSPGTMSVGTFSVSFRLLDAAGNQSNSLSFTPGTWYCKFFLRVAPDDRGGDSPILGVQNERRRWSVTGVLLRKAREGSEKIATNSPNCREHDDTGLWLPRKQQKPVPNLNPKA